eukprot:TRINITY_DN5196_c0_g1_i1.p1 TRINITY_DN5196_c0_g1~~TRINITY_DN5196_c0_g1_i1.p1  ORF type:complete len:189 (-),score=14.80 TRINITY_DN5196_c0_g1_i1:388-954(-)
MKMKGEVKTVKKETVFWKNKRPDAIKENGNGGKYVAINKHAKKEEEEVRLSTIQTIHKDKEPACRCWQILGRYSDWENPNKMPSKIAVCQAQFCESFAYLFTRVRITLVSLHNISHFLVSFSFCSLPTCLFLAYIKNSIFLQQLNGAGHATYNIDKSGHSWSTPPTNNFGTDDGKTIQQDLNHAESEK